MKPMSSRPINAEDRALLAAVDADPIARDLLSAKCRWEQMGRHAVLREWGDPREWPAYKRALPEPVQEKR